MVIRGLMAPPRVGWRIKVKATRLRLSEKVGKILDFYFLSGHCLADTL
jgi:hypothetical protein